MVVESVRAISIIAHKGRQIPRVATELNWADRLGSWMVRWGIGRMKYTVEPGLYCVGGPTAETAVFVTANYKMSFDRLRSGLAGRDGWILVLDTKGINVWCAAGKGTFGTEELVSRIENVGLGEIVAHKKLIVPQLGATGVSAHAVKQQSGFQVLYGPVRAKDLPAFLDGGMKATEQMRRVTFPLADRIVLIPVELISWGKHILCAAACLLVLAGLSREGYSGKLVVSDGIRAVLILLASYLAAGILGPALLPWLPGRAFSAKGIWIGLAISVVLGLQSRPLWNSWSDRLDILAWFLMIPALTSFVVMNFTGASTYTSLSGVKREMKIAVPLQLVFAVSGVGLWLAGHFV